MTQTVPETDKTNNQAAPETIETNGLGVPSIGHDENLTNKKALEEVLAADEDKTGTILPAEKELDDAIQNADENPVLVERSADITPVTIHPEVAKANVTTPEDESQVLQQNIEHIEGAAVVGHEIPTNTLGETQGEFNPPPPAPKPESPGFPPLSQTGILGDPKRNGEPLHRLAMKRLGELLFGKGKLVAGSSEPATSNVVQIHAPKENSDIQKAA